jgi:hypothetical protein
MSATKNIAFILKDLAAFDLHIKPLIDYSGSDNYNFYVYHVNNFYSPEIIIKNNNVCFIDLSKNKNATTIICKHKINFIISINPGNIFDLFIISVAKVLNIPTAYYQHGVQLDFTSFDPRSLYQGNSLRKKMLSIRKYAFFYSFFFYNILTSKKRKLLIKTIKIKTIYILNNKNLRNQPKYGIKENHADYAFVYGESDKDYLIKSMNMCSENIFISGYPFVPFDKFKNKTALENKRKTVLYLSTALRTAGVIPMSIEEEKDFYRQVNFEVQNAGCKLILKLHPIEDESLFKSYFNKNDVEIIRTGNLSDLTYESDLILGEYTTAFFYPIRLYKPIIIIKSKYFKEFPFDFSKFGIGIKTEIENLSQTIKNNFNLPKKNIADYDAFNKKYINYNNNESSFSLVYKHINKIINKY